MKFDSERRCGFVAGLYQSGNNLCFSIPIEIAKFKNMNLGQKIEYRLLKRVKMLNQKKWIEFAILKARVAKSHKTLMSYVSRKIETENDLNAKDEIGIEILGVC